MKQIIRQHITVDYCKKCGGIWLDKGEMQEIIKLQEKEMEKFKKEEEKKKKQLKKILK